MNPVVYADFNRPLCYLAGLWVDRWTTAGVAIDWRAVEHAPGLSALGTPSGSAAAAALLGELADIARLPVPADAEDLPADLPQIISNTRAAVAAYAEAVSDGVQDEVRRRIMHAIWSEKRHLSSAYDVRRIITDVMWPRVTLGPYRSTTLPRPMSGDPDPWKATRRQGGTIAPDGGPLTTIGYRRIRAWRDQWRALGLPLLPVLIDAGGWIHHGPDAVTLLADPAALLDPVGRAPEPAPVERVLTPSFH